MQLACSSIKANMCPAHQPVAFTVPFDIPDVKANPTPRELAQYSIDLRGIIRQCNLDRGLGNGT